MANIKEFTIKVNGVEQSTQKVDKLSDSLEKVDVKAHDVSVSAKDIASTYKDNIEEVVEYIVLQMSKIGAIITELGAHLGQAVEKNKEAAEKMVVDLEKYGENSLSVLKVKAIEASSAMEAYVNKIGKRTEEQSAQLTKQVEENKKLIEVSLAEIEKKYEEGDKKVKDIGLESYKKYVKELKKHKEELDTAILHTSLQYDAMSMHYDKDSAEFKKAQEDKKAALDSLQKKTDEVNAKIKQSNLSFLDEWKKQYKDISEKLEDFTKDGGKIEKFIDKYSYGFKKFSTDFDKVIADTKTTIDSIATKEKELNDKKYEKKIKELDKELENLRTEAITKEKEKARLEKEQEEAKKKAEKYRADIKRIEDAFEIRAIDSHKENLKSNAPAKSPEDESSTEDNDKKEEIEAARNRLDELANLAAGEEKIVKDKQSEIDTANKAIIESNRSVLLEQMRIEDEKTKLQEEQAKKQAEIEEKARKRKEQLEKLEKIKAKAKHVYDTAIAIKNIAKGVTEAWALGPFIGPPAAAFVAVNGAIQLGIMAQQLKYMENGGLLKGRRHTQGGMRIEGTNIEVEGGEYVVNRESTDKNIGLIRYINSQRRELTPSDVSAFFTKSSQGFEPPFSRAFEVGGQLPAIDDPSTIDNEFIVEAIRNIRIEPRVSVTDINRVQGEMVSVDGWVGL